MRCRPGTSSRNSASGSASRSRLTNTSGPHVSTCTGTSGTSSFATPNTRRDGTSRSRPARSQVQRWNGQRISLRPSPRALAERASTVPACVLECAQLAVVAPHDQHRQRADAVLVEVAGSGDVVDRARELPHARPQLVVFERAYSSEIYR